MKWQTNYKPYKDSKGIIGTAIIDQVPDSEGDLPVSCFDTNFDGYDVELQSITHDEDGLYFELKIK